MMTTCFQCIVPQYSFLPSHSSKLLSQLSSQRFYDGAIDKLYERIYDANVRNGFLLYDDDWLRLAVLK